MIITQEQISITAEKLFIQANRKLPTDIIDKLHSACENETSTLGRRAIEIMLKNLELADPLPICQDTGMAVVFCDWGSECTLDKGTIQEAINIGIANGCKNGYLRPSIVNDPLRRINTGDNTPAIIHFNMIAGNKVKLTVAPKGFGSENMTALNMFTPAAIAEDIIEFVVSAVKRAGANPCPPIIVGVGLGGNAEMSLLLAKKALLLPINETNLDPFYADLEYKMLEKINMLKIGPQGLGGDTTALSVKILHAPTHIAGLPCGVSIGCWVTRHATAEI